MRVATFALWLYAAGSGIGACAHAPPKFPAYCYDEVAFTAKLVACVEANSDRASMRACRADVHARCGITMSTSARSDAP